MEATAAGQGATSLLHDEPEPRDPRMQIHAAHFKTALLATAGQAYISTIAALTATRVFKHIWDTILRPTITEVVAAERIQPFPEHKSPAAYVAANCTDEIRS